jgi:hypothetical protein
MHAYLYIIIIIHIYIFIGYWRSSRSTDTIFSCDGVSDGCYGGYEAGDESCRDGYHGPLCGECKKGLNFINIFIIVYIIEKNPL